jgi:hypothetical protein
MLREREKQLVEKNANLTALKDTMETSVNQFTNDLKGSKAGIWLRFLLISLYN